MSKICIIVPCYNEYSRLSIKEFIEFTICNPEISFLFVDDGSIDNTWDLISEKIDHKNIFGLKINSNIGKAEAVRRGVLLANNTKQYLWIGYWDADLSTPLSEIIRMQNETKVETSIDIILGSRIKCLGTEIRRSFKRHFLGRIFATFSSSILKMPVYDTQCGAKIIKADCIDFLFTEVFISKWLFDVEILARYRNKNGVKTSLKCIRELPLLKWHEVGGSKLKISHMVKIPFELFKIRNAYNYLK